jgi:hypothetical protein
MPAVRPPTDRLSGRCLPPDSLVALRFAPDGAAGCCLAGARAPRALA